MGKRLSPTRIRKGARLFPSPLPPTASAPLSSSTASSPLDRHRSQPHLDVFPISGQNSVSYPPCQDFGHFLGHENTAAFFAVLHRTDSAVGGSTVARVLTGGDWMPSNLNLYAPAGCLAAWEEFLKPILYGRCEKQPDIDSLCAYATSSHTVFESPGLVIMITESVDECIISPAVASSTTLTMSVITSSTIVAMYPTLMNRRHAMDSWDRPTVAQCITLQNRGFKHSGLRGVGLFCWGGADNEFADNSKEGVPFSDVSLKWRLSDVCMNMNCPWSANRWM
ncbi:hypothetical protein R3P38DRAFT_3244624 [Favolaschia claudopus]|uniref:Uncharacterized protein n=1 Tax=Favolaschia claudopus TaxID=2862362 RepID=A0AAV9Z1J4_9AGAR